VLALAQVEDDGTDDVTGAGAAASRAAAGGAPSRLLPAFGALPAAAGPSTIPSFGAFMSNSSAAAGTGGRVPSFKVPRMNMMRPANSGGGGGGGV
jgi:hypothetical protein